MEELKSRCCAAAPRLPTLHIRVPEAELHAVQIIHVSILMKHDEQRYSSMFQNEVEAHSSPLSAVSSFGRGPSGYEQADIKTKSTFGRKTHALSSHGGYSCSGGGDCVVVAVAVRAQTAVMAARVVTASEVSISITVEHWLVGAFVFVASLHATLTLILYG